MAYFSKLSTKRLNAGVTSAISCSPVLGSTGAFLFLINDFIETPFDLLVNYYDVNKSGLLLLSTKSKAKFKVGFDTVDKRVNHFIIKTLVENYNEFVLELFKYLKILNKI